MNLINTIFSKTADLLQRLARKFNITYNEINIIVYYFCIPLIWTVMIDYIISLPLTTPYLLGFWTCIWVFMGREFRSFCDQLFRISQEFLLLFQRFKWNYYKASVIICVYVPILFTAMLLYLVYIK